MSVSAAVTRRLDRLVEVGVLCAWWTYADGDGYRCFVITDQGVERGPAHPVPNRSPENQAMLHDIARSFACINMVYDLESRYGR